MEEGSMKICLTLAARLRIETRRREGENGAALISSLLISVLLLAGGTALVLTSSMQATTAISSTSEVRAYYAAEAGLQAAVNVLRGNVAPVTGAGLPTGTSMSGNFQTAVTPLQSNKSGDPLTTQVPPVDRLSGWLDYSYPSALSTSANPSDANRVPLSVADSSYNAASDTAYSVQIRDPDNNPAGTEPSRLIVSSTGYGPNGAIKVLQMMVQRSSLNVVPPATLTLRGSEDGSALSFDSGASNAKTYSGVDNHGGDPTGADPNRPAFATTGPYVGTVNSGISKPDTITPQVGGNPLLGVMDVQTSGVPGAGVSTTVVATPWFLQAANNARQTVADLKAKAQDLGVYDSGGYSGTVGGTGAPAFLFVDGDATIGPSAGAGLLVVTGNLTLHGNPDFDGLILVLGTGTVTRDGGGNGTLNGAMIIAKFDSSGGFKGPSFNTNGDGNSTMQYDSVAIKKALNTLGRPCLGVVER
jgi:hypothetical protein